MKKILLALLFMPLLLTGQVVRYFFNVELTNQFVLSNSLGESYKFDNGALVKTNQYCFGISTTHGIGIKEIGFLGIGIGIDVEKLGYFKGVNYYLGDRYIVPIFFYGKYNFIHNKKITPYIDFKIGTGVEQNNSITYDNNDNVPMFFFNPRIGLALDIRNSRSISIAIGYNFSKQKAIPFFNSSMIFLDENGNQIDTDNRMTLQGLTLSLGFNF